MFPLLLTSDGGLPQPNFGCGTIITDSGCVIQEGIARMTVSAVGGLGNFIADTISGAFNNSVIEKSSWTAASSQFWFWATIMAGLVLVVMVFQVGIAAILGDHQRMAKVTIGGLVAIPFAAVAVQIMEKFVELGDGVTTSAVTGIQGGSLASGLVQVLGIQTTTVGQGAPPPWNAVGNWEAHSPIALLMVPSQGQNGLGQIIIGALLVVIMAIAAGVLFLLMQLRDVGLLALAAMAPIALMFVGQPSLAAWGKKWGQLALGLILAKPLAAGVIVLLVKIMSSSQNIGMLLVVSIGIIAAALSPVWAVSLVSFTGGEAASAFTRRASMSQQINKTQTFVRLVGRFKK